MKSKIALFCVLFFALGATAQTFKDFGVPSAQELKMTSCELNPDADAVVLVREAVANYDDRNQLIVDHHVRIKILRDKGISYADVVIPYISSNDFEFITDVEALVINSSGTSGADRIFVEKKSIYDKKITKSRSAISFTFPVVKVGSIVEYRYRSIMKSYSGLEDWNFQEDIPVLKSRFSLTVLPSIQFSYMVFKSATLNIDIKSDRQNGKVDFQMNDIPALTEEPYMDARRDYLQRVMFQVSGFNINGGTQKYMNSWEDVIKQLIIEGEWGGQLNKNLSGTDDFIRQTKALPNELERLRVTYDYVRQQMSWNGYYGVYTAPVKEAWSQKSGSFTAINLILLNLLESVNVKASPMLVADRSYGKVNATHAFIDQFTKTIAYAEINGRKYYLDASEKYLPFDMIPSSILNTTGLVVNRKKGGIQKITDENLSFKETVVINMKFKPEGKLEGDTYINSQHYARTERIESYRAGYDKYLEKHFKKGLAGMDMTDFELQNEKTDTLPLTQKFRFSLPVTENGGYRYIGYNYFTGYSSNPFIANKRFSSINFGFKQNITSSAYLEMPEGYQIDHLPKSVQLSTPDKDLIFVRECIADEKSNKLLIRLKIERNSSYFNVEQYDELKQFYKMMFDYLDEQVVLKKIQ